MTCTLYYFSMHPDLQLTTCYAWIIVTVRAATHVRYLQKFHDMGHVTGLCLSFRTEVVTLCWVKFSQYLRGPLCRKRAAVALVLRSSFIQCGNPQGPIDNGFILQLCFTIQTHLALIQRSFRCQPPTLLTWMHNYQDNTLCRSAYLCVKRVKWRSRDRLFILFSDDVSLNTFYMLTLTLVAGRNQC